MTKIGLFYPQKMGHVILQAMEEALGRHEVQAVLQAASLDSLLDNYPPSSLELTLSFQTVSLLQSALEQVFGPRGGRGVALRIGRACFKYGLKEFGPQLGFTETTFRLLPLPAKLRTGMKSFADLFNGQTDKAIRMEESEMKILWYMDRCPLCLGRHEAEPACHLAVGLLQEFLYWVSSGKVFHVEETTCIARGDAACTIEIEKNPIS